MAELVAIREAFSYCAHNENSSFIIFTDSKSAVTSLRFPDIHTKLNNIQKDILTYNKRMTEAGKSVKIAWLRGHSGIEFNEHVDRLAKSARDDTALPEPFPVPYSDLHRIIKQKQYIFWQEHYINSPSGAAYKNIQTEIPKKIWFHNSSNRVFIRTISRIRTSHALCLKHMYRLNLSTTEECLCGEVADLQHIFFDCPNLQCETLLDNLTSLGIQMPFNLSYLLFLNRIDIYRELFKFAVSRHLWL